MFWLLWSSTSSLVPGTLSRLADVFCSDLVICTSHNMREIENFIINFSILNFDSNNVIISDIQVFLGKYSITIAQVGIPNFVETNIFN